MMTETPETAKVDENHSQPDVGPTQAGIQLAREPGPKPAPGYDGLAAARARRRYNLAKTTDIIWLITGVLDSVFMIRVLLKLIGANPQAGFAQFVYNMSAVFLAPFNGLTETPTANGSALELSTLIAMLVYVLAAWGVVRFLWVVFEDPIVR
jgi:uncharacterized protein YggT (Ycf19 family)